MSRKAKSVPSDSYLRLAVLKLFSDEQLAVSSVNRATCGLAAKVAVTALVADRLPDSLGAMPLAKLVRNHVPVTKGDHVRAQSAPRCLRRQF